VLMLPDRDNLFDALDGVPARGKGVCPMRGDRHNNDARFTDFDTTRPMVYTDACVGPCRTDFVADPAECPNSEWLIRFVVEERHAAPLIVIANQTDERRDGAIPLARPSHFLRQDVKIQRARGHGDERYRHRSSIATGLKL
jgi:hypothetical protein